MLEEVIDIMVEEETKKAQGYLQLPCSLPEKILAVLSAFRPQMEENTIVTALNQQENLLLHDKVQRKINERAIPILSQIVEEGLKEGIFDCDHIANRVKMILILSNNLFDDSDAGENMGQSGSQDMEVFIDLTEKLLGAKKGTMGFLKDFITAP